MTDQISIDGSGLPKALLAALMDQAQRSGVTRLALVGGVVRDVMLHHVHRDPWRDPPDLDFVLEGSCVDFVQHLREQFGDGRVPELHLHPQFGTAELLVDGVLLDVACARMELSLIHI